MAHTADRFTSIVNGQFGSGLVATAKPFANMHLRLLLRYRESNFMRRAEHLTASRIKKVV
jgi:hypothetical protein